MTASGMDGRSVRRRRRRLSEQDLHKRNRWTLFGGLLVVFVLAGALLVQTSQMKAEYRQNLQYYEQQQEEYSREESRSQELEIQKDYVQSKEYIEKIAREKLNLVNEDEILIKPKE